MAYQVKANPEELFQFSRNLKNMGEALKSNFGRLKMQCNQVNESWQDESNRKFMDVFLEQAKFIDKISDEMDRYGNFINKKANALQIQVDHDKNIPN